MFTLVVAQRLGLSVDLAMGLAILEGVVLTIALMLLVERYLFSTPALAARAPIAGRAGDVGVATAAADAGPAAGSRVQA